MIKRIEDKATIKRALVLLAVDAIEHNTDHVEASFDVYNKVFVSCKIKFDFDLKEEETLDD